MLKLKQTWNTWKLCKHSNGKLLTLDLYSIHKLKKTIAPLAQIYLETFTTTKRSSCGFVFMCLLLSSDPNFEVLMILLYRFCL
jgi:hypothetical protein